MDYYSFNGSGQKTIVFFLSDITYDKIQQQYLQKLTSYKKVFFFKLVFDPHNTKTKVSTIKQFLLNSLTFLKQEKIDLFCFADSDYAKVFSRSLKKSPPKNLILTSLKGHKYLLVPSHKKALFDPVNVAKDFQHSFYAINSFIADTYHPPGTNVIHKAHYPATLSDIEQTLEELLRLNVPLTCDVETFSLKHPDAGIGTISFAINQHEGVAFQVDNTSDKTPCMETRKLLKNFFIKFQNKLIFHKIAFDATILIYQLFMEDILDQEGMFEGFDAILKDWDCTLIMTYLASNSAVGNSLKLKEQSLEYMGVYALASDEIKDITTVPLDNLLSYNLQDTLATWFVYKKHLPTLKNENQLDLYNDLFKPATLDIIQMQLTGIPLNMDKVLMLEHDLNQIQQTIEPQLHQHSMVLDFINNKCVQALNEKNLASKKKVYTFADIGKTKALTITFNPNSSKQLIELLYSERYFNLPVLDLTDKGNPSTNADALKKLVNVSLEEDVKTFLNNILELKTLATVISTFIPAFKTAYHCKGHWRLFGSFNLGGTKSGRLSSSDP